MLDARLKPFTDDREAIKAETEANATAQKQYTDFVNTHQFATTHEQPIARLLAQSPNLSPEAAYFQLKAWALERKLDFSKPLAAQLTPAGGVATGAPAAPFPDGSGGAGGSGSAATDEDNTNVADPSTPFADIIRDSMRDAGMKI